MSDITETARRVLELSARAFDTRSLAYQQANETLAGAAEELARALLESQAALAAANARADLAYEEKALADREFVASQKIVRELVDGLRDMRGIHDQQACSDRCLHPDCQLAVRLDALLAKHAAPAPTPADTKEDDRG
jgi:hypothetical protein